MAQKHNIEYEEKPMTRDGRIQGPSRRYRRLRHPTFPAAEWTAKNPLLQRGEIGAEADTHRIKVGDGLTYWNDLPYASDAIATWGAINGNINDQTDLKNALDAKQDVIADLATIRSNASAGKAASDTIATYGNIVTHNVSEFATAAQGAKADTAVQPGDLATVATTGDYDDLLNKPTIPAAQVNSDWNANSGVAEILNKPTLGTAAAADTTDFATAAQGSLADTAVQPADLANYVTTNTTQTITGEKVFSGIMNYSAGKTYILAGNGGQKLGYWTYDIDGGSNITLQTMTASTRDINFKTNNGGKVKYNGSEVAKVSDIPTAVSQLSNDSGFITNAVNNLVNYTLTSSLATVATSGDYDDLLNKPTIPAAQVNSDWDAVSGVAQILNKPTIPTVNDATISITQNGMSVGSFTLNQASGDTIALTDTTYSVMTGASAGDAGTSGLVPAPAAGDQAKFLQGDGTWANPTAAVAWGNITGSLSNQTDLKNALDAKQDVLTAGSNINITGTTISATDTTYTGSDGITLTGTNFTNSGVRSVATGTTSGTISVNTNGTSADVAINGWSGKADVATTLAGYGITDGANTDLSNLTITGKATGAHLAMPSSTYDNLTLGASGSSYTAPADGWFVLIKEATALYQYIDMSGAGGIETGATAAISGSQYLYTLLPASKGSSISIYYTAGGSTIKFRFIYANGAA